MSSSIARVFSVHGSQFGAAVIPAGDAAAAPAEPRTIPDVMLRVLTELTPETPERRKELGELLGERFELNRRTQAFIDSELTRTHDALLQSHEAAKLAVREQGAVLENLKKTLVEDSQETLRAQNILRLAQTAAFNAEQEVKNISRFASQKEIDAIKRRLVEANKKMAEAEAKAGDLGQSLNFLKIVTVPAEQRKLAALIEKEMELAAQLEGRDPVQAALGIMQR